MGGLKTYLAGLAFACASFSAQAMPSDPREQVQLFASCAGRFSAQMEYAWLVGHDGADERARRHTFVTLLDAVFPASDTGLTGPEVLDIRIRAKHAQARLLQTARFDQNGERSARARARAQELTALCNALILS